MIELTDETLRDIEVIRTAIRDGHDDQRRVAIAGLSLVATQVRDCADGSEYLTPVLAPELAVEEALRVRMSDTVHALMNAADSFDTDKSTMAKLVHLLASECLLYLALPKPKPPAPTGHTTQREPPVIDAFNSSGRPAICPSCGTHQIMEDERMGCRNCGSALMPSDLPRNTVNESEAVPDVGEVSPG